MATKSGATFDFRNAHLVIGSGFRVDAYDVAGLTVAWAGDRNTVALGADNINVIVSTGNTAAVITVSLMASARFLDYVTGWLEVGGTRPLSFEDGSSRIFLADPSAIPRQQPNMTFAAAHNAFPIDIHCPNLEGVVGGLNDG